MLIAVSSGVITGNTQVTTRRTIVLGLLLISDGTNDVTACLNDGLDASGKELFGPVVLPGGSRFAGPLWPVPVVAENGVYLQLSGTNAKAIVYYESNEVI